MTVAELVARFPEIPEDLHEEPTLAELAEKFDSLLQVANKPSPCAEKHTDENKFYLKLIGAMDIYRYGLYTRERVLEEIDKLLVLYRTHAQDVSAVLLQDS